MCRRGCAPDPPPVAPVPGLVHRLTDPRTDHPGHHDRHLVARNQRLYPDQDHQCPHRGLQSAPQTGQTGRMWVQKSGQLSAPDTIPLHPQTTGRNPDFMLIARLKSKSPHTSRTSDSGPARRAVCFSLLNSLPNSTPKPSSERVQHTRKWLGIFDRFWLNNSNAKQALGSLRRLNALQHSDFGRPRASNGKTRQLPSTFPLPG